MAVEEISVHELHQLNLADVVVVDVREEDEYLSGHVPGAISVPLSIVADNVEAFRHEQTTYVICQVGGRSMRAAEFLADAGITVINVAGGTGAWITSGYDIVGGDTPR